MVEPSVDAETDLIARARDGNAAALEELVRRYQPQVYRFGVHMCGDADAAADVLQDTLLSFARSVTKFRGDAALSTWLYTIARRACLRQRRRGRFEPPSTAFEPIESAALETRPDAADTPEEALSRREQRAALDAALAALAPADRAVVILRDVQGLTAQEAARALGVSTPALKSRLHRARAAVREHLEPSSSWPAPPGPGSCPDAVSLFSKQLEGELSSADVAAMMAHLDGCPRCGAACDSLKRVLARCRQSKAPVPPAALGAAVRDAIRIFLDARVS